MTVLLFIDYLQVELVKGRSLSELLESKIKIYLLKHNRAINIECFVE